MAHLAQEPGSEETHAPAGGAWRPARWRLGTTRALKAALLNLAVGFGAVALATVFRRPDLAALVTASLTPPLLVVTFYHAIHDLNSPNHPPEATLQAWLALLVSLMPMLLIAVFLLATNPAAIRDLVSWTHLVKR
jgi:hypothetical protein